MSLGAFAFERLISCRISSGASGGRFLVPGDGIERPAAGLHRCGSGPRLRASRRWLPRWMRAARAGRLLRLLMKLLVFAEPRPAIVASWSGRDRRRWGLAFR